MKYLITFFAFLAMAFSGALASGEEKKDVAGYLQAISVTIKASGSEGSGVLFNREIMVAGKPQKINFVWTAAHVIDNLRSVRTIIAANTGTDKKLVEFKDPDIVRELVEHGRRVGEIKMATKVLKYSEATQGHDLAILLVRKIGYADETAKFYKDPEEKGIAIGTQLYHVGSLLGQTGNNSMTTGIMSQVGRVLELGSGEGKVFDQTTVTAFPGSSGGGVFLADGQYIGMLVRGAGETFNMIVPIRRMREWAKEQNVLWALDDSVPAPTYEDILKLPVE